MRNKNGRKGREAEKQVCREAENQVSKEARRSREAGKAEKWRSREAAHRQWRSREAKKQKEAEKQKSGEAKKQRTIKAEKQGKAEKQKAEKQRNRETEIKNKTEKNNTSINKAPRLTKTSKEALYCLESANLFNLNPLAFCPIFRCEVLTTIQNIARSGFVHGQGQRVRAAHHISSS